jgi:hypothetical protein
MPDLLVNMCICIQCNVASVRAAIYYRLECLEEAMQPNVLLLLLIFGLFAGTVTCEEGRCNTCDASFGDHQDYPDSSLHKSPTGPESQCTDEPEVLLDFSRRRAVDRRLDSREAKRAHQAAPKPVEPRQTITAVTIDVAWTEVELGTKDSIWTSGVRVPISNIFEVPLIVKRHMKEHPFNIDQDRGLDNQPITCLMINPATGFAPPEWQVNVGPATVARADRKPLSRAQLDIIYEFVSRIVNLFESSSSGRVPRSKMDRAAFQRFWLDNIRSKKMSQLYSRSGKYVDWDAIPMP